MKAFVRSSLVMILAAATIGCASKKNVSGTITHDGKPLVWKSEGGHLLVVFVPEDRSADSNTYLCETERDGTFRIAAIPRGKYRVAIQQFDERHNDALGHRLDPAATPLVYEVTHDGQVIDVDLPKNLSELGKGRGP